MPVPAVCERCGATFEVKTHLLGKRRFCSRPCQFAWQRSRGYTRCRTCGREFHASPSQHRRYCSRSCAARDIELQKRKSASLLGQRREGEDRTCEQCSATFYVPKCLLATARFCSEACYRAWQKRRVAIRCERCGIEVLCKPFKAKTRRFCSVSCASSTSTLLERIYNGKRARVHRDGYVRVWAPESGSGTNQGWLLEHRLVMEDYLGRALGPDDVVHHVNGDKIDNRLENLVLLSRKEHQPITNRNNATRYWRDQAELAEYRRRYGALA